MRRCLRIIAKDAGDADNAPDPSYQLTLDINVSSDGIIVNQRYFGCADDGGERFPFVLEPPRQNKPEAFLFWGNYDDVTSSEINIVARR